MHILVKLLSNHNNLRTTEIIGEAIDDPKVGERFIFHAQALCPGVKGVGGFRLVYTSPITEVNKINPTTTEFKTKNSTYRLEEYVEELI